MAARDGMTTLIARLRDMVGDPNAGDPAAWAFTDEQVQDYLDERSTMVGEARLRAVPSTVAGVLTNRLYAAPVRWWESDAILADGSGNALTPDSSDPMAGQWTFDDGVAEPVYISGRYFDLYGAAQSLCEAWAAKVARDFDFATDQQTFDRTGKREGLLAVAREFARKAVKPGKRPTWRATDW
jgi:hypothetical protein